jgi:hypothetical protein
MTSPSSGLAALVVDTLSKVFEPLDAFLQTLLGELLRGSDEHIASAELSVPASQPVEVVLFLVELSGGQLLDRDLFVDLLVELGAFAHELAPLLLSLGGEELLEATFTERGSGRGVEHLSFTAGALDEFDGSGDSSDEVVAGRDRPGCLLERQRPDAPQLPPHGDAVSCRLGGQPIGQEYPRHNAIVSPVTWCEVAQVTAVSTPESAVVRSQPLSRHVTERVVDLIEPRGVLLPEIGQRDPVAT